MKVTLTEKGIEFYKELKRSSGQIQVPHTSPVTGTLLKTTVESPRKPATAFPVSKNSNDELLDTLLPALISASPPQDIEIKRPRVPISMEFKSKYSIPLTSIFTAPKTTQGYTIGKNTLNITMLKQNPAMKTLYTTLNRTGKFNNVPQLKIIEVAATNLITTSLKTTRVKELQLEEMKQRDEMELQRAAYLERLKMETKYKLNANTKILEDPKLFDTVSAKLIATKGRYTKRIIQKHNLILNKWNKQERILLLSRNKPRRVSVPYMKIKTPKATINL